LKRHPQSDAIWNTIRNAQCKSCSLHEGAQSVCLLGDGPVPCEAMIVGEAPGYREDEVQVPFSGKSGIFLRKQLKEIGLDPREIFITNVVSCRPPANRTPTRKEAKTCASLYLNKQLELVKPKATLLLGNIALAWALGKKAAITKYEGNTFTLGGQQQDLFGSSITCVPSRHPSAVIRLEGEESYDYAVQAFKENLLLFKRTLHPIEDQFKFSQEPPILEESVPYVYGDIESNGLNPFKPDAKIHCVGWAQYPSSVSSYMLNKGNQKTVPAILRKWPIIAHRTTFEGIWFRQHYGITPRIYHDTKVMAYLIDENEPSGLKYQAIKYLGVDPWSESQDFQNPDPKTLLPYNARDNSYGLRLYKERDLPFLRKNPKIARLLRYLILPAIEVFIEIICNGFHIDMEKAQERLEQCLKEMKKLNKKLNMIAGREINPGSPKQMARLLYDQLNLSCPVVTAKGANSTSEAALIRLRGMHPATDILWDWRGWDKKRSTYLEPWIRQGPDLHANYGFTDTDTGRLNSSMVKDKRGEKKTGGVLHQCPRDPFIRTLITARHPDWCIVAFDWSQIELRLVAHVAEEPTMMEIFNSDGDIHLATAMDVLGLAAGGIDKETRKKAKAVNFGFVYGMHAPKFVIYCLEKFDLKISEQEGRNYRRSFFRKYHLLIWHRKVESFVKHNGYIDSVFGRRRHLPQAKHDSGIDEWMRREAVRQGINSPIQAAGSDLLLFLMALIGSYSLKSDWKYDRSKVIPVGSAHDSGLCEVRRDYVKEFKAGIQHTVKNLPIRKYFGFDFRVPIKLDITAYSDYWEGKVLDV
jgi:uracil-DNA glycosylase family 4